MDNQVVHVPVSVLLNPDQAASTKVVWMAMRLHPAASPAELEVRTGLSRKAIAFAVRDRADLEELQERLVRSGQTHSPVVDHGSYQAIRFVDPDGHLLEAATTPQ